jgi:hypothetical protein
MAFARTMETFWYGPGELEEVSGMGVVARRAAMRSWTYWETWTRISRPRENKPRKEMENGKGQTEHERFREERGKGYQ